MTHPVLDVYFNPVTGGVVKLIRNIEQIDASVWGCAVTLGNFDGVHRGHAAIIGRLKHWAKQVGGPAVVFTFDPHPVRLLRPELAPPPLTWTQRKAELLGRLQVDVMIAWPTTRELLNLSYRDFFHQIIVERLNTAAIVEGPNFYFGKNREGNVERLQTLCRENSVHCEITRPTVVDDELISSTRIRNLIHEGRVDRAKRMLTQPYRIRGMVVHGAGRGSGLGYPTANLDAIDTLIPGMGVYAGIAFWKEQAYVAAVHIGPSPTFGVKLPSVEVHLLDFNETVYGEVLEIDFLQRLRGVDHFESVEALRAQMDRDIAQAREIGDAYLKSLSNSITLESES